MKRFSLLALPLLLMLCAAAQADTVFMSVNGTLSNSDTFTLSFSLPGNPVPTAPLAGYYTGSFTAPITETINGVTSNFNGTIYFYPTAVGSGLGLDDGMGGHLWTIISDQLYSGTETAPVFAAIADWHVKTGPYDYSSSDPKDWTSSAPDGSYFVTASGFTAAVPEPSTLWLLFSGALVPLALRRRR